MLLELGIIAIGVVVFYIFDRYVVGLEEL